MAQYVYRRPPYPYYDMVGIESWLEDLIRDGLWLDKDGYVFGMMQFRPGTPSKLKYRLEPIEKQSFLYLGQPNPPSEKALALYEEFGWEYLGTFYDFYIYRSIDESAVELNTDPTLQAQALRHVRRRSGLLLASLMVILIAALGILVKDGNLLLQTINRGWERTAVLLAYLIVVSVYGLVSYLHTVGLQKKLERGESLKRNKNWRRGRFLRQILIALPFLMYLTVSLVNAHSINAIYDNAIDPETYHESLPFVTMADMDEERTLEQNGEPQLSVWSTPLTPTNIYWTENIFLNHPDDEAWSGGIELSYHEASTEWIARELMREYLKKHEKYLGQLNAPGLSLSPVEIDASAYGFDELVVYENLYSPIIFLRNGKTVIKATVHLHIWGDNPWLYPLWLERMAEKYA